MKELTKAEEQIMQVLWDIGKGFVHDFIEHIPEPKPAYNTVSTIIRILEKKGFIHHKKYGKTYEYYPSVTKSDYTTLYMKKLIRNYFGGSFKQMVSFFTNENNLDLKELDEIKKLMEEKINNNKE